MSLSFLLSSSAPSNDLFPVWWNIWSALRMFLSTLNKSTKQCKHIKIQLQKLKFSGIVISMLLSYCNNKWSKFRSDNYHNFKVVVSIIDIWYVCSNCNVVWFLLLSKSHVQLILLEFIVYIYNGQKCYSSFRS